MKKIFGYLLMLSAITCLIGACDSKEITYSGPEYVMFSDSAYVMPILEADTTFEVTVGTTTACKYDRNFTVDVMTGKTTAIRGHHFDFVDNSNNVTVKAGERTAKVRLKGYYNNVGREDSLVVRLKLVAPTENIWGIYNPSNETLVEMVKCYRFKMSEFIYPGGNFLMYASFPYGEQVSTYPAKLDESLTTDSTVSIYMFDEHIPVKIKFDDSDALDQRIIVPAQPAFKESNYGIVYVRSTEEYPSYFIVPDRFFVLYLDAYAPGIGSFGVYEYIFKCLSESEAEDNENGVLSAKQSSRVYSLSSQKLITKF